MNCTEVGELMQRNLDYDLNEQELETLMTHLSDCAQCTLLFEKLTLLSGSLEQLPRVVPSISIVDAILPELERIDKAKANSLIIAKQRRTRWLTTAGSIATAAAIVVLMVNLNGTPAFNSSAVNELAMNNKALNKSATEPAADFSNASAEDEKNSAGASNKLRATDMVEQYSAASGATYNDDQSRKQAVATDQSRVSEGNAVSDTTPSSNNSNPAAVAPEMPTNYYVPELTGSLTENIDKLGSLNELALTIRNQSEKPDELSTQHYLSLDELVYLQVEEHILSVYETSSNQLIQRWDLPQQGLFEFMKWDDEGKSFTFQITNEAGEITSYTWELNAQQ